MIPGLPWIESVNDRIVHLIHTKSIGYCFFGYVGRRFLCVLAAKERCNTTHAITCLWLNAATKEACPQPQLFVAERH